MRDLALTFILVVLAPLALRFPFAGVYVWVWLSLMNPHRLTYGFAQDLPFNMVVAALTVMGWVVSRERLNLKFTPMFLLLGAFAAWITVTTIFAPVPEFTTPLWNRNIKTMLLLGMIMALITTQVRLHGLVWVVALSLGYFGLKGGGFMILTGGNYIVFGPVRSMIEDNNALALALITVLPLMNYLRLHTQHQVAKLAVIAGMLLTLAAVIGSYSRGGFIAMAAMLGFLWLKTRAKLATGLLGLAAVVAVFIFMPDKYRERLSTIGELTEDTSFLGRIDAWQVAFHTATDRFFGAGFDGPRQEVVWNTYLPEAAARASHSVYFMVLGEHGFIGLALYLAICFVAWRNLSRVLAAARNKPEWLWAQDLASALQVGMVGFLVGGAALAMAYYDGFLILVAMSACLLRIIESSPALAVQPQPARAKPIGHGFGRPSALSPKGEGTR